MRKIRDLTGQRFGRLLAIYPIRHWRNERTAWFCKCICGATIEVAARSLPNGNTQSCGCLRQDQNKRIQDLMGQRFGRLMAIYPTGERRNGHPEWLCRCDCGNETKVPSHKLRNGHTKSCGCLRKDGAKRIKDLTGQRFGRLTALRLAQERPYNRIAWTCLCNCGNEIVTSAGNLARGLVKSCGCLKIEQAREKLQLLAEKRGPQHHNWNPNRTAEDRELKRDIPEYKEWRAAVYKRDSYTCQYCEDPSKRNLNAHHIQSYADNLELRTAIENGVTLCKDCHEEFHRRYGRGNNTRKQFEQFLQSREGILL